MYARYNRVETSPLLYVAGMNERKFEYTPEKVSFLWTVDENS